MTDNELIEATKSAAQEVYRELGAGYIENVYEEAMAVELRQRGLNYTIQRTTEVFYKGVKVGTHRLDFVVEDKIVAELKAGSSISKSHTAQLRSYLKTLGMRTGVVVNFPYPEKDDPDFKVEDMESSD